jgi:Protein of unknown function (DUF3617)
MFRRLVLVAASLLCAGSAFAFDMPTRKAGLWELQMKFEGRKLPAQVIKQCTDAASDKYMNANYGGAQQGQCAKREVQHVGNTIVVDSVCQFGPATTTSHAVVTGSFDSAYTVDVTSQRSGGVAMAGMPMNGPSHMRIEAKWLGPCAAGERPGDMIMGGGFKMNILDMQKMHGIPNMPQRP